MEIKPSKGALFAMERLERAGYEAYAVGGCVRDSLLQGTPNDWDLTTNASPRETLACFPDCRVIETGLQHGTVTVIYEGEQLEITTYRVDGDYKDNRHPASVTFSRRLEDDLSRRDFTVNAMAYHPDRGLVDRFGGQADLAAGLIRCVGDAERRFHEDGLRILRAIRFASVLGFSLEEKTARAVHSCKHLLKNIAAERIREEFNKLICGKGAVEILRDYVDVIAEFLPEVSPMVGFDQQSRFHRFDVWEHTLFALSQTDSPRLNVRLGILLHDVGKPLCFTKDEKGGHFKGHAEAGVRLTDEIMRRLRYDNATRELMLKLVRYHDIPIQAEKKHIKRAILRFGERGLADLLEIQRCDRVAHQIGHTELPDWYADIPVIWEEIRREGACLSLKDLAVNGNDLIALGYRPGKELGACLNRLLNAVIDEELPNDREILLKSLEQPKA
ncbi:MAG: HD domain-containing protein [Ruminococcaceae bacterium]|nr:HD domain-containing protein [Oscillospiraceae bacterium]